MSHAPRITLGASFTINFLSWLEARVPSLTDEQRGQVVCALQQFATETIFKRKEV